MFTSKNLKSLVIVSLLGLSTSAMAATGGDVDLAGQVESTLAMTATATAGATSLDMSPGVHIVKVGDLTMGTNNEAGLTLTNSSGQLTSSGASAINFSTATVGDEDEAPVSGDFSGGGSFDTIVGGFFERDLYVIYAPASLQNAGTYTGQIDLTVTDN